MCSRAALSHRPRRNTHSVDVASGSVRERAERGGKRRKEVAPCRPTAHADNVTTETCETRSQSHPGVLHGAQRWFRQRTMEKRSLQDPEVGHITGGNIPVVLLTRLWAQGHI